MTPEVIPGPILDDADHEAKSTAVRQVTEQEVEDVVVDVEVHVGGDSRALARELMRRFVILRRS